MAPLEEPGDNSDRLKRALETHSIETVRFLVLAKEELGDSAYNDLVKTILEIVKQSANPDGGITIEKCQEILSQASPHISDEDYNDLLTTLCLFRIKRSMAVEDVYDKVMENHFLRKSMRVTRLIPYQTGVPQEKMNYPQKFESDIMLQRFRATADFIGNLQNRVDNDMKIQEHLTPLLSEAKEINMERSMTGVKNLSSCNSQYHLVSDDAHQSIDLHIHKDIENIVSHASYKKISSEHKPVMIWMRLVQAFVSANCQLPELNCTIAPEEACERCGLSKKFLRSILNALLANNFPLSSKTGECLGHTSNNSNSIHYGSKVEIEDGEFVPCIENIQMDTMLGPVNGGAGYDVAASSGDGSSFQHLESSIRDNDDKAEVQHESIEGPDVEMGSLAYSKTVTELCDLKGAKTCCSMVVLCRLHQSLQFYVHSNPLVYDEGMFKGKLFKLLNGSTDNSKFEEYCLRILGPRSYSSTHPLNGSAQQNSEGDEGSKLHEDTVKPTQNHFHRRKKRKLENSPASLSQPSVDNSDS
ncbi:hypothetical protein PR202_gb02274 [Eleusine coracana subsp. coracana]|uniref:Uncharacterized protein n=1 Tax=Eleusine coracana subsp. coracana TaxID=191504 RepID=A0AAV5DY13_ELECO|nr:hypothetical protein PR202_gb02274 [Eleusine coracana subsp. coracana]